MLCVIGLMSGTSMDGIDLAMLKTDGMDAIETG
ncbi:MAG: Anhydro-N-acetylmuramic acid kinase, partial [Rhizobiaceae bacterium]|nr:Anhydro-N-acetylmuramic acid kinase [Rhizobiaceae bacterium]